jgi:glucose/arabinose dehydrogenase
MQTISQNLLTAILLSALLSACGGSSDDNGSVSPLPGIACNAETAEQIQPINLPIRTLPSSVPSDGAAIAIEPAFTALSFTRPVAILQAPTEDQCWFVVEQPGIIRAFKNLSATDELFTFIDITGRVAAERNEAGLLGMAFHPDYAANGQVFISYTGTDGDLTSYVSRFTSIDSGKTLDPDSEEILLTLTQPFNNHNGGNILFGPDGYLYIGFGDGGSANDPNENAQNTLNLFGTILRIDVDGAAPYAIPDDNPFAANEPCVQGFGAANCPEIFAWGLRNPWRWSFDKYTETLWLGDVGQNAREEINIVTSGGNYGWPFYEGTLCNDRAPVPNCEFEAILPITEYPRTTGRSVTGGYVYRGLQIWDLFGVYVYADYATGIVFQYFKSETGDVIQAQLDTELKISSFGQAHDGELYLLDLAAGGIHKITAE